MAIGGVDKSYGRVEAEGCDYNVCVKPQFCKSRDYKVFIARVTFGRGYIDFIAGVVYNPSYMGSIAGVCIWPRL